MYVPGVSGPDTIIHFDLALNSRSQLVVLRLQQSSNYGFEHLMYFDPFKYWPTSNYYKLLIDSQVYIGCSLVRIIPYQCMGFCTSFFFFFLYTMYLQIS